MQAADVLYPGPHFPDDSTTLSFTGHGCCHSCTCSLGQVVGSELEQLELRRLQEPRLSPFAEVKKSS